MAVEYISNSPQKTFTVLFAGPIKLVVDKPWASLQLHSYLIFTNVSMSLSKYAIYGVIDPPRNVCQNLGRIKSLDTCPN